MYYKENKIAMRWRTEKEVISGKGLQVELLNWFRFNFNKIYYSFSTVKL